MAFYCLCDIGFNTDVFLCVCPSHFTELHYICRHTKLGRRPPPKILHTNHTHTRPPPYLLRRLQSPHFSTLLHSVISHMSYARHGDGISTSATRIIISLLEPIF